MNIHFLKPPLTFKHVNLEKLNYFLIDTSVELKVNYGFQKRLDLNKVKATRHRTEKNTAKIKQQSGLLAYPTLLKDYEEKAHLLEELTAQTDALKRSYKNTTRRMERLRETIRKRTLQKYTAFAGSSSMNCVKK